MIAQDPHVTFPDCKGSDSNTVAYLGSDLPVFVPVHDPTRKAYYGIRGTKSFSVRYEADRFGSRIPEEFMNLEGLHKIFSTKVVRHSYVKSLSNFEFHQIRNKNSSLKIASFK